MSTTNPDGGFEYDNVFVCYTPQNLYKATYLAHERFARGERSLVLTLLHRDQVEPTFLDTDDVPWADFVHMPHGNDHVRILTSDHRRPGALLRKLWAKALAKVRRDLGGGAERRRVLAQVARARNVYLFLERTYFSSLILRRRRCTLVEEGVATYLPFVPFTALGRRVYPGQHANVTRVLLQRPDHAAEVVRPKVEPVVFAWRSLPTAARTRMRRMFPLPLPGSTRPLALLVGQAWTRGNVPVADVLALYRRVVAQLRKHGFAVCFKPHPAESVGPYAALVDHVLAARMPLEALDLAHATPPFACAVTVLESSLGSSAGWAAQVIALVPGNASVETLSPTAFARAADEAMRTITQALGPGESQTAS